MVQFEVQRVLCVLLLHQARSASSDCGRVQRGQVAQQTELVLRLLAYVTLTSVSYKKLIHHSNLDK